MDENLVKKYVKEKYVDDINFVVESIGTGVRWEGGSLRWNQEWEDDDTRQGTSKDRITIRALTDMANSISEQIEFTYDCADDHGDGKVPMLDLQVWRSREEGRESLLYSYYEKPITSPLVIMEKSALPASNKMTVLAQEVVRRLRNTAVSLPIQEKIKIMDKMMIKLRESGYDERQRKEILYSGVMGYCRMMERERLHGRRVNRPREEGAEERRVRKLIGDSTWFKSRTKEEKPGLDGDVPVAGASGSRSPAHKVRGRFPPSKPRGTCSGRPCSPGSLVKKEQPETVVFVPATGGSKLRKSLQKSDNMFAELHKVPPVRFVERGGRKVSSMVGTPDPWGGTHCGRDRCVPCSDDTTDTKKAAPKGACNLESCTYVLECKLCETANPAAKAHYYGETGRSAYSRGKEHADGVRKGDPDHPIVKHMMDNHNNGDGQEPEWRMKVVRMFKRPLQRQVSEGVTIEKSKVEFRLNSKSEWNSARIPRLQVEIGDWTPATDYRGSEQGWRPIQKLKGEKTRDRQEKVEKSRNKKPRISDEKVEDEQPGLEKTLDVNRSQEEKEPVGAGPLPTRSEAGPHLDSLGGPAVACPAPLVKKTRRQEEKEPVGAGPLPTRPEAGPHLEVLGGPAVACPAPLARKTSKVKDEWKFLYTDIRERKKKKELTDVRRSDKPCSKSSLRQLRIKEQLGREVGCQSINKRRCETRPGTQQDPNLRQESREPIAQKVQVGGQL